MIKRESKSGEPDSQSTWHGNQAEHHASSAVEQQRQLQRRRNITVCCLSCSSNDNQHVHWTIWWFTFSLQIFKLDSSIFCCLQLNLTVKLFDCFLHDIKHLNLKLYTITSHILEFELDSLLGKFVCVLTSLIIFCINCHSCNCLLE